jgi:hypothetical protein
LRFAWPFSFEDAFFQPDGESASWIPSPLWERYHADLQHWKLDDGFFDRFPEVRGDVEGDWVAFAGTTTTTTTRS